MFLWSRGWFSARWALMRDEGSVTGATAVRVGLDTVARDLVFSFLIVIVAGRGDSSAMWKPTGRKSFFFWTQLL